MSVKSKIMKAMIAHPKLVTFAIGFGITMAIGTAIGMLDLSQTAFAVGHVHQGINQPLPFGGLSISQHNRA